MEDIKNKIVSAVLQEPVLFKIKVNNQNLLHRIGLLKKEREFSIYPLVTGSMLRISKEINRLKGFDGIDLDKLTFNDIMQKAFENIEENIDSLFNIVVLAIHNKKSKPSKRLKKFLLRNLTNSELFKLVTIVLNQLNVQGFMLSIILIKGMSLINQGEIIAPGQSSEEYKNISDSE